MMCNDIRAAAVQAREALKRNQPVNHCVNGAGERFPMLPYDPLRFEANAAAIAALGAALAAPQPIPPNMVFEAGWRTAAKWAKRDDLYADTQSAAYMRDRDAVLAELARLLAASPAPQDGPEGLTVDQLSTALAECRDAFPTPPHGGAAEHEWMQAIGDPLSVPLYVRAALAAIRKEGEPG